jgi:hypothetical protein
MAYLITVDDDGRAPTAATGVTVHGCVTTAGRPTRLPAWLTALADRPTATFRATTRRRTIARNPQVVANGGIGTFAGDG